MSDTPPKARLCRADARAERSGNLQMTPKGTRAKRA
jgi:hypothetical protein